MLPVKVGSERTSSIHCHEYVAQRRRQREQLSILERCPSHLTTRSSPRGSELAVVKHCGAAHHFRATGDNWLFHAGKLTPILSRDIGGRRHHLQPRRRRKRSASASVFSRREVASKSLIVGHLLHYGRVTWGCAFKPRMRLRTMALYTVSYFEIVIGIPTFSIRPMVVWNRMLRIRKVVRSHTVSFTE